MQGVNVVKDLLTRGLLPFADRGPHVKTIQSLTLIRTKTKQRQIDDATGESARRKTNKPLA